jgi:hypothetical protein
VVAQDTRHKVVTHVLAVGVGHVREILRDVDRSDIFARGGLGASAAFSGRRGGGGGANEGNGDVTGACRCGGALGPGNAALTAAASAADVDSSRRSTCARCEVDARANRSIDAFPGGLAAGVRPGGVAPVGAGAWSSRAVLPLSRSDRRESMQRRGRGGGGGEGGLVELSCLAGVCRWEFGSCACAERAWKVAVAKTLVVARSEVVPS